MTVPPNPSSGSPTGPAAVDPVRALYGGGRVGGMLPAPTLVERAGRTYPTAVARLDTPVDRLVRLAAEPMRVDPVLAAGGAGHLETLLAATPALYDGDVVAFDRLVDGALLAARARYFTMLATCDVLRAELAAAAGATALDDLPLRRRAHELAGDPLRSGAGRAAAIGVSVVTTVPSGDGRRVLLGRRRRDIGADAGRWHVAPSGMLEPAGLAATVAQELREEVGVELPATALGGRLQTLGVAHDLTRLRPDVCLLLALDAPVELPRDGEFDDWRLVPVEPSSGVADVWRLGPGELTAPAAGALCLFELLLQGV